ncbi:ribosome maturation protein SBDS [Anaeramoeba flamelloides]|uniref:Ribosome maturation protein SBDS n=1 Tax=Anaeramoeba flamelloides TaxID=1746091 RepID=A0AAV7Y5D3_9EUKA|nr:ribosome maturation protein SBDS [Anaeramoeba flamelloides]
MSEKSQIIRYKKGKKQFEVLTKPGSVSKYREGKIRNLDDVLITNVIFKNHNSMDKANTKDIQQAFGTTDNNIVIEKILKEGQLHLTTEEVRQKTEQKRKEVVNYIHKYYTDPKTKKTHPVIRIENALKQAKVRIEYRMVVEEEIGAIVKKLVGIISLKKSEVTGTLMIPHSHLGKAGGAIRKYAEIQREKYTSQGCKMEISLVPGNYENLIKALQSATQGNYTFDVDGEQINVTSEENTQGRGRGRGKGNRKQKRKKRK